MLDKTTLFYHVHLPKTGGTTVAHLLVSDICAPKDDLLPLAGWNDRCKVTCELGFTDNEFSCNDPHRNDVEHNAFNFNLQRAEALKQKVGAQKIVYVTTLRRGSDRVVSQWKAELGYQSWGPPDGVLPYSMKSLQLYITGGNHTGKGWLGRWNTHLRNNYQVGMLASQRFNGDTKAIRWFHVEEAKKVLMTGDWIIGFTDCIPQVQEKLMEHARKVHGSCKDKAMPHDTVAASEIVIDEETQRILDRYTALDNALFDWAWDLAERGTDPRFTRTC
jgi:hypothetical protein